MFTKSLTDLLPFGKKETFGLDIGSSSIKLVQLGEGKKGYFLTKVGMVDLPGETIVDGSIIDSTAVVGAIRDLVREHNVKARNVASSISGHSVIIKKVELPVMTEDELADSIQWEAEQYIPFDINDVNIDFQIMGVDAEGKGQMEVLLVACKKEVINDYTNVIREAGLNPVVIDIDSFSLENMFEISYSFSEEENIVLVNIGAGGMNINVLRGGMTSFSRDIPVGGYRYTEEIQKEMNLSFQDAETLKITGALEGRDLGKDVGPVIDKMSNVIAQEVKRTLDFFLATSAGGYVSKIYMSGGSSIFPALPETIHEKTGVVVERINPFNNLDVSKEGFDPDYLKKVAPFMGVGVGLAIRRVGDR
ncbi:MAG: type IV pilus assembly protein PilM [Thermodesulfobacteriota bacterium]